MGRESNALCPRESSTYGPKQLPSNLTVGVTGFEPATFCTPCRRASQVTLHPVTIDRRPAAQAGSFLDRKNQYPKPPPLWQRVRNTANALGSRTEIPHQ